MPLKSNETITSCFPSLSKSTITGEALTSSVAPKSTSQARSASSPSIILKKLCSSPPTSSLWIIIENNESPPHLSTESWSEIIELEKSAIGVANASVE